jgi:electron transfer flavoprotein alpha subunit
VTIEPWPTEIAAEPFKWLASSQVAGPAEKAPRPLESREAARVFQEELGFHTDALAPAEGLPLNFSEVDFPDLLDGNGVLAVVTSDSQGRISGAGLGLVAASQPVAATAGRKAAVLLVAPRDDATHRRAIGQLMSAGAERIAILSHEQTLAGPEVRARLLIESWPELKNPPIIIFGESWAEPALTVLRARAGSAGTLILRVRKLDASSGLPIVETARANGRLRTERILMALDDDRRYWVGVTDDADVIKGQSPAVPGQESRRAMGDGDLIADLQVQRWTPRLEKLFGSSDMQRLIAELKEETGVARLSDADFIIDVGYGVGNRDGYEEVIAPLEAALRSIGVAQIVVGGSRKVTEELHLLPAERQIGQSGVSVNPRVLLAIGISGAPQHLNYIGPRAVILAFNRDPEAPLLTLNQRQPRPKVFPIVGDLFQTVPAFIAALDKEPRK